MHQELTFINIRQNAEKYMGRELFLFFFVTAEQCFTYIVTFSSSWKQNSYLFILHLIPFYNIVLIWAFLS